MSETAGVNSRLRWEIEPGNDLFIVFNHGVDTSEHFFHTLTTELTVKVSWTWRF